MKYIREQRLDIARCVYDGELTVAEATVKYELSPSSVKGYLRLYRAEMGLPSKTHRKNSLPLIRKIPISMNMNPCQKNSSTPLSWHG